MSDIEDYAYSPYDDLEDILYDADPAPELADELAEHALHSPVYLDEIAGYELEEYHSDWDYYSDDYMDDDPVLEKAIHAENVGAKRGKKRKLIETKDIPALDLNEARLLTRSIKGTIWAKPGNHDPPIHNVGQGDTISLMKDWKEVFSIEDDGWSRRPSASDNDESWAMDMSLADMGLQPLQSQKSFEQGPAQREDESEEEADEDEADRENEDMIDEEDLPRTSSTLDTEASNRPETDGRGGSKSDIKRHGSTLNQVMSAVTIESLETSEDENPRKRPRRKAELPSPPNSTESIAMNAGDHKGRTQHQTQSTGIVTTEIEVNDARRTNRKRKASEVPLADEGKDTRPTAGTRSKRLAAATTNGTTARQAPEMKPGHRKPK